MKPTTVATQAAGPILLGVASLLTACGHSDPHALADRICEQAGDDSILAAALTGFVNRSDPEPGFLVYIPATDSTPPPAAVQQMENRRTTYMYSTDPKLQAEVDKQIKSYGDYDALLVAYHGISKTDPLHPVVTFSGRYIANAKIRGRTLGPFQIRPQCDTTGSWTVPPAPSAAAAAPAQAPGAQAPGAQTPGAHAPGAPASGASRARPASTGAAPARAG